MAVKFLFLLMFVSFVQILKCSATDSDPMQQKFTSKCDDLCIEPKQNETENANKSECLRGCQYFNIEFLVNARNKDKLIDLNQLVERCGSSCSEAYGSNKSKKEECFRGCNEMMTLQAKAPFVNGWLVYMGATDRNMVLLQPDFDIPSKEDWVLLDSMFRASDYEYDTSYNNGYEKMLADSRGQIKTSYIGHEHLTINYCIPTWMWMLPIIMLAAFIWIHYSNYIHSVFIRDDFEREFGITNPNNFNAATAAGPTSATTGAKILNQDFVVASDFYFYPSPSIPPPKYADVVEQDVIGSDDEDESPQLDSVACSANNQASVSAKRDDAFTIVIPKSSNCNDKQNLVVDI